MKTRPKARPDQFSLGVKLNKYDRPQSEGFLNHVCL